MPDKRQTLGSVASDIIRMYRSIAGDKAVNESIRIQNILGRRLALLTELSGGRLGPDDLNDDQGLVLQECFLDAIALQMATGGRSGVYAPFSSTDSSLVGRSRLRRAKLVESDQEQMNWHFQTLVQAWAADHSLRPIKELEGDARLKGLKSCDFAIERPTGRFELIECKRFRPEREGHGEAVDSLRIKLTDRIPDAVAQLTTTANAFGASSCDTHLLIDVTAYTGASIAVSSRDNAPDSTGFDDAILSLATHLADIAADVDKLTLCWHVPIKIDDRFRAIVQRTTVVRDAKPETMLGYSGWTVEAYPLEKAEYRELRVSNVARSFGWIVTSYRNLSDPGSFLSIGPEVRVK